MTMRHPRDSSPSSANDNPEALNQPKVHKILQGIRQPERFSTWGERWGGSDYATRVAPGLDGSNGETRPIYDVQIEFSPVSTNEEYATASEPETHRRHSSRTQNRRSERCSGAKRVEPYRGSPPIQKLQSGTAAVEHDFGLACFTPASSPEGYPSVSSRKRSRVGKAISAPSTLRRHANPAAPDSGVIPTYYGTWPGASSHSSGPIPTTFPPGGIPLPDWLASSTEDGLFQHNSYPLSTHDASMGAIAQTGHQASVETSYATPGDSPPGSDYSYNMPDSMIWPFTYPVVTATRQTVPTLPPYTVAPGVNRPF